MTQAAQNSPGRRVTVETTARLHMGFVDLNGGLGRRFGSIGLTLDRPMTRIYATLSEGFSASGPRAERVLDYARDFAAHTKLDAGAHFEIDTAIPEHAGLGSGTQLGLAVGMALSRLHSLNLDLDEIALQVGRGMRSGIGIGAFRQGGLLVDGGRGNSTQIPPVIARMDFPVDWRIILVCDPDSQGVHGKRELQAFSELPEFPAAQAAHLARLVLMQALPAVAEQDLKSFGSAISELQCIIGDHFAPAQGGGRYISAEVADAMAWLESQGVPCLGQSSWGPTGFAVVADEAQARHLVQGLAQRNPRLRYEVSQARNEGSVVREELLDEYVVRMADRNINLKN